MNRILGYIMLLTCWSCSGSTPRSEPVQVEVDSVAATTPILEAGVFHPRVKVPSRPTVSYAIFLPKEAKGAPLVLWLDPQGEGNLPVQKYQQLAQSKGIAMAGLYNSKNGLPASTSLDLVNVTLEDLKSRVAPSQIFLGGFSGGARVAAMVAQNRNDISGVIGCGAGYNPQPGQSWPFYGLVGRGDFNYLEFRQLEATLERVAAAHWIEYFEGEHAWPEVGLMAAALDFMVLRTMEGAKAKENSQEFAEWGKWRAGLVGKVESETDYQEARRSVAYLSGILETENTAQAIAEWEQGSAHAAQVEAKAELQQQELSLREELQIDLQLKDVDFWRKKVFNMRMAQSNRAQMEMQLRVLNYLSLVSYSLTGQALQHNDLEVAEVLAQKYALIDPPNPEPHVQLAQVKARQGMNDAAIRALEEAAHRDFDDAERLRGTAEFNNLQASPGWTAILEQVQANFEASQQELNNPSPTKTNPK